MAYRRRPYTKIPRRRYMRKRGLPINRKRFAGSSLHKYLVVVKNPFTEKCLSPKYPDGSATSSLGIRLQMSSEVEFSSDNTVCYVALFPGVGNHICWQLGENDDATVEKYYWVNVMQFLTNNQVSDYRPVSCGLHVKCVNNSDANDGWWQGVRVPFNIGNDFQASNDHFYYTKFNTDNWLLDPTRS